MKILTCCKRFFLVVAEENILYNFVWFDIGRCLFKKEISFRNFTALLATEDRIVFKDTIPYVQDKSSMWLRTLLNYLTCLLLKKLTATSLQL